ncbi:E3 ubiquitin-protein ligase TRIM39-like [Ambystoma mexicanum]|uniref:E3 ubiquitin-protein ligase TRIM39-like n=1 Tax=Ambystoma mexicanum TaxID=8296 RepID=UPI0037E93A78
MAAATDPMLGLQDEASCPICLELFRDPVSVECGHSFCRACINQSWRGLQCNFPCPHCRRVSRWKKLRPNRQLANMAELAEQLARREAGRCPKHHEPLRLYCEDDRQALCLVCRESWSHRAHTVVPVEESTDEYKCNLVGRLAPLRNEVREIQKLKLNEEKKTEELKNKVGAERQKMTSQFAGMRQVMDFQERVFLNRLEEVEKTIEMAAKATIKHIDDKLASLNQLIMEIEKSGIRQAAVLLKNVVDHFTREKDPLAQTEAVPTQQKNDQTVEKSYTTRTHQMKNFKVTFTLDNRTSSPQLSVARDRRSVKYREMPQNLPNNPERFNGKPCILGSRGFTSGRHYWEVEVGGGIYWTVGVAKLSVRRKGPFKIRPHEGIWAIGLLGLYMDQYWAFTSPDTALAVDESPRRIGVYLDYEQDQLSFYNADSMEHIFTFECSFQEKVLPFFCVGALGTEISL